MTESKDRSPVPYSASEVPPQMDLTIARGILERVVSLDERTITPDTPLDRIGGHTTEEVRQAMERVRQDIAATHGLHPHSGRQPTVQKHTPEGKLSLILWDEKHGERRDHTIDLRLQDPEGRIPISNVFNLEDPTDMFGRVHTGFIDIRRGLRSVRHGTLSGASRGDATRNVQLMVEGARWQAANMLDWGNPHTILPEQLGAKALPTGKPKGIGK